MMDRLVPCAGRILAVLLLLLLQPLAVASSQSQEQAQQPFLQRRADEFVEGNNTDGVCPPCPTCSNNGEPNDDNDVEPLTMQILVVDSPGIITMVKWNADDYFEHTNGRVRININLVPTMPQLFAEIEDDARSGGGLFDAYYTNPVILGSAATLGGFADLSDYVKESPYSDWTDVLLALRTYVTSFEDKIYIILLDGDTHTMFYRKDVLDHFGLQPPRTWNEYTQVAKTVHGSVFNNITLSGSCVSRIQGDHAMYWYHLVLSTITQTQGTSSGSLFDTQDMTPLTGEAVAEMLRIHEEHSAYGTFDEYTDIINHVQNGHMNDGSCAMTFMWGDLFRRSNAEGSILHDKLGIAPTPGSELVLDRETGQLVPCDRQRCPYAKYYDDIGFVNSAPYAANGGWGAAISANTSPEKQKALAEFFLWASSREQAQQYVIPNATLPWYEINGQDPWRKSQLDVDKWVAQGYEREVSKQYVESILSNLVSKNVVVEARFPKAGEIMSVLDKEVNEYLVRAVVDKSIAEEDKERERLKTAQAITEQWEQIIRAFDARGDTVAPILETYQRLRGVYVPNEDRNYLDDFRPFGLALMALLFALSLGFGVWVYVKRNTPVVKASQPPFLWLICLGTMVMTSSIYTMGVDDGIASFESCSRACQTTPWLVAVGFSITFAALASKIWRLLRMMRNAAHFRRIQVSMFDVLLPFCIILVLNMGFLLTSTLAAPLEWERVDQGRTSSGDLESYGRCHSDSNLTTIMLCLVGAVNLAALIGANLMAYMTRQLTIAFNESKFVGFAMGSILQAFLIGVPLLFLADDNPMVRYVVRVLLVFVVCISVLLFIFVPKILHGDESINLDMRSSGVTSLARRSKQMTGSHVMDSAEFSHEFSHDLQPHHHLAAVPEGTGEDGPPEEQHPDARGIPTASTQLKSDSTLTADRKEAPPESALGKKASTGSGSSSWAEIGSQRPESMNSSGTGPSSWAEIGDQSHFEPSAGSASTERKPPGLPASSWAEIGESHAEAPSDNAPDGGFVSQLESVVENEGDETEEAFKQEEEDAKEN